VIRLARESDVARLVEMGLRFRRETDYQAHLTENPEKMAELARQLIGGEGMLISEREGLAVGMIGWVLFPHFLSGEMIAGEVCWWVDPEQRGEGIKLLRASESRAKAAGAVRMQMIAPNEKVAALYRRLGYVYVESAFQRTL
jgi:GNAT superfamily N-acetyltransferase